MHVLAFNNNNKGKFLKVLSVVAESFISNMYYISFFKLILWLLVCINNIR